MSLCATTMAAPQCGQCQVDELSSASGNAGCFLRAHRQQLPAYGQLGRAESVCQISEVANPDKAFRQHVQEESAEELRRHERHLPLLAAVGIVFPAEGYAFAVERQEPMVGNGDAMGVSAQVTQNLGGTAKGGLGIDHPVLAMQSP